jgi:hypothetical protein
VRPGFTRTPAQLDSPTHARPSTTATDGFGRLGRKRLLCEGPTAAVLELLEAAGAVPQQQAPAHQHQQEQPADR